MTAFHRLLSPLSAFALALALAQFSAIANAATVMAVLTSSKGTTVIDTDRAENSLFVVTEGGADTSKSPTSLYDVLAPAGLGAAQIEVKPGFCAVVGDLSNFTTSKRVSLAAGSYNVKTQYGLSNGIQALAVYWAGANGCQSEYDLIYVRDPSKSLAYPAPPSLQGNLPWPSTTSTPAYRIRGFHFGTIGNLAASVYWGGRTIYYNSATKGGFLPYAKTLTIPTCKQASLFYDSFTTLPAGEYSLSPYTGTSAGLTVTDLGPVADCIPPNAQARSAKGALIRHNGNNLCLNPEGGGIPTYDTRAVLTNNCDAADPGNKFRMLVDGSIQHVESGLCLHPRGGANVPYNNTELVFWPVCRQESIKFEYTASHSLRQMTSDMCLHPYGGSPTPSPGTKVVFWNICNEDRLRFTFDAK